MAEPMDVDVAVREYAPHGDADARAPSGGHDTNATPPAAAGSSARCATVTEKRGDVAHAPLTSTATSAGSARKRAALQDQSTTGEKNGANVAAESGATCRVCGEHGGDDEMRVCANCRIAVHTSCYGDSAAISEQDQQREEDDSQSNESTKEPEWKCDCCAHEVASIQDLRCVFCEQPSGDYLMKFVETQKWQVQATPSAAADGPQSIQRFAHLLCSQWDPHTLYEVVKQNGVTQQRQQQLRDSNNRKREERSADADTTPTPETETEATRGTVDDNSSTVPQFSSGAIAPAPAEQYVQEYDFALDLPSECCFCASSRGIRIKCQHLDCGLFFHAMCAHERSGHVEIVSFPSSPLTQYHAYCARHHDSSSKSAYSAYALIETMVSKPIAALTGRDAQLKLHTIKRRLEFVSKPPFTTINAFFAALATVLVDLCKKGLRTSKADPPVHNMKHLQALQFVLDHVPQLQVVYRAPREHVLQIVLRAGGDSELFALLQKTFNPPKYLGKYAGPVSQVHECSVCAGPFHERQHLFYCSHETTPHLQHWKCTKRRSNFREREKLAMVAASAAPASTTVSKTKRSASSNNSNKNSNGSSMKQLKSISLVVNGQWHDVQLPKRLPGLSDELICGICRSDVNAHGLIASRKEAKSAEFEKKKSNFVHGGCFMNPADTLKPLSVTAAPARSVRPPVAPKVEPKASSRSGGSRGSKRSASAMENSKASNGIAMASAASEVSSSAPAVLGPPKMERINVQRTTKWLAYVAQIIRLAGTVAKLSSAAAAATANNAATTESTTAAAPGSVDSIVAAVGDADELAAPLVNGVTTDAGESVVKEEEEGKDEKKNEEKSDNIAPESTDVKPDARAEGDQNIHQELSHPLLASQPQVPDVQSEIARLSRAIETFFDEAIQIVRPFDAYVLNKLETARGFLRNRNGPAVGVLRMIAQEYTRFVYVKHTRAVEKATNEKRKREEQEAQELRDKERKRLEREAELALKSQMLAMRKKQRKLVKMG